MKLSAIFLLTAYAVCLLSCSGKRPAAVTDSEEEVAPIEEIVPNDISYETWHKADSLLGTMTLRQKVGQCFMPTIMTRQDESTLARMRYYADSLEVGGVVLLKGNIENAIRMAEIASEAKIPMLTAIDAEWGLRMRLEDAPDFPRNGKLAPEVDDVLLFDYGREVARESRRIGINMVLGPVVDVAENPRGVIGNRSFGSDPRRVSDLGVAYARGVESGGVISVAKHFPGHGSTVADSHKSLPVISRPLSELDSIDLYPFRSYISAGLSGIMVGHLAVPAIEPKAVPAAVSSVVMNQLLRDELEFKGLIITDALNMAGASGHNASEALGAGADIILGPYDTAGSIEEVIEKIREGELTEADIDDRCRRILFYKLLFGFGPVKADSIGNMAEEISSGAVILRERLSMPDGGR